MKLAEAETRIQELEEIIKKVLAWRNLDGDGISDPLRQELYKLLESSLTYITEGSSIR